MNISVSTVIILMALSFLLGIWTAYNLPTAFAELHVFGTYLAHVFTGGTCPKGYSCIPK